MDIRHVFIFIAIAVAASFVLWVIRRVSPPPFLVQRWAHDHAYRILQCEYRALVAGPFSRRSLPRHSRVYRVQIEDLERRTRTAYVACIPEWGPGRTEVAWDVEQDSAQT